MPLKNIELVELIEASKYSWVDSEILGTPYALNSLVVMRDANIEVSSPSDWSVLLVESGKRIYNNFDECFVPFYECLFTQINLWMPCSSVKWMC